MVLKIIIFTHAVVWYIEEAKASAQNNMTQHDYKQDFIYLFNISVITLHLDFVNPSILHILYQDKC